MVRLTDRPDMTLDVYRGRKTTMQQQQQASLDTHYLFKRRSPSVLNSETIEEGVEKVRQIITMIV